MIDPHTLVVPAALYGGLLLMVAVAGERGWLPGRIVDSGWLFGLALLVSVSAWTLYGAAGSMAENGLWYLGAFVGTILGFALYPVLIEPLQRRARERGLRSLADLFARHYGSSRVGVVVSVVLILSSAPYIALQFAAVEKATGYFLGREDHAAAWWLAILVGLFALVLAVPPRRAGQRREGLLAALALESTAKITVFLAVGMWLVITLWGGAGEFLRWTEVSGEGARLRERSLALGDWTILLLASFFSFLLPRQTYLLFAEAPAPRAMRTAAWLYPVGLALATLPVPVVYWAGVHLGLSVPPEDFLAAVLWHPQTPVWLPPAVYLITLSAAGAMILVTTLALAEMLVSHLALPWWHARLGERNPLRHGLWLVRLLAVAVVLTLAFLLHLGARGRIDLTGLGLLALAGMMQCVPGLAGVLLWRRGSRDGVMAGMITGVAVWLGWTAAGLSPQLREIVFPGSVHPITLWTTALAASLLANGGVFAAVSLIRPTRKALSDSTDGTRDPGSPPANDAIQRRMNRILGRAAAARELEQARRLAGPHPEAVIQWLERDLTALLGPRLAVWVVHGHALEEVFPNADALTEPVRRLSSAVETLLRRYRTILTQIPVGLLTVDRASRITFWNPPMERITGLSAAAATGRSLTELPLPWNTWLLQTRNTSEKPLRAARQPGDRVFLLHHTALPAGPDAAAWSRADDAGLFIVEDVTEQEVGRSAEEHQRRLQALDELLTGLAHEIGNPLTAVSMLVHELLDTRAVADEARDDLRQVLAQIHRIDTVLRAVRNYARPDSSTHAATTLSLHRVIRTAMEVCQLIKRDRGTRFRLESSTDCHVETRGNRLLHALVTLLNCAAQTCPPETWILLRLHRDGSETVLDIQELGAQQGAGDPGIPPNLRDNADYEADLLAAARLLQEHGATLQLLDRSSTGGPLARVRLPCPTAA